MRRAAVLVLQLALFTPALRAAGAPPEGAIPVPRIMARELRGTGWTPWEDARPQPALRGERIRRFLHPFGFSVTERSTTIYNGIHWSYAIATRDSRREQLLLFAVALPLFRNRRVVTWYDDIYRSRPVTDSITTNSVPARSISSPDGGLNSAAFGAKGSGGYGASIGAGGHSPYPFACVSDGQEAFALAIDIGTPVVHRFLFRKGEGLVAEFAVALSPRQKKSPGRAELNLYAYPIDPAWGFRSAAARYYELFPEYFARRIRQEGIWIPFTAVPEIEGWADFGIAFHETSHEGRTRLDGRSVSVAEADRTIGVTSFQYTEPWDIQLPFDPHGATYASAESLAARTPLAQRQILRSVAFDEQGQWIARLISAPWFTPPYAISYTTSAAPDASTSSRYMAVRTLEIDSALAKGFDGIYFDSLEFFWHYDLDYRPEHVAACQDVLTFSADARHPKPAVWNYASQIAMIRTVCRDLHGKGKLAMGNGFTWLPFAVADLDILGTEFSWFMSAEDKQAVSAFRRTACGPKPVVLLLNEGLYTDDFIRPPHPGYVQYFEESLLYGMYPSFFSADAANDPYWKRPEAYNTGRPFFRKYVPLIKELNRQGWQPVTCARASDARVMIERYDAPGDDLFYLALRNPTADSLRETRVVLEEPLRVAPGTVEELVRQAPVRLEAASHTISMDLAPRSTYLLRGRLSGPGGKR